MIEKMEIPGKYILSKQEVYFDDYGRGGQNRELKEELILAVYTPVFSKGLRLQFSFGRQKKCLTTFEKGKEIVCRAGWGWNCQKSIDAERESIYWDLEKCSEETEYYEPYLWVSFANITVKKAGVTYLEIEEKKEGCREYIPIVKTQIPPCILRFSPVAATIRKGQAAVLKWEAYGAEGCVINPGNHKVEAFGTMEVKPEETMLYTLDAVRGQEKSTEKTRVYLYEDVMEDYLIAEPAVYYRGSKMSVYYKIQNRKGTVDLIAGGAPVEIETAGEQKEKITVSFASAEKIAFSYMEQGKEKVRYLELCPDEEQVIMKYRVAAKKQEAEEGKIIFGIEWSTKGAAEIQLFVRVYPVGKENSINGFKEYLITATEEEGIISWTPDSPDHAMYFFFLRTKNRQGELKEAVYAYKDQQEVGSYDNLGN
ncbi:MAG: hypothetical protein NC412_04245 [Roseburia sp.]|nr:hypothetical protein [Roseburia sp.]MCM1278114.1 hypothetical protein [Robinsoniella sp.]